MSITDYIVKEDKFEEQDTGPLELTFPCCACKHKYMSFTDEPCSRCGHNAYCDDVGRATVLGGRDYWMEKWHKQNAELFEMAMELTELRRKLAKISR